jgi:diguanylate cyclase (GGDEF)-like protein
MTERIKILAVDDRPENLLAIEALLDGPEVEVVKATSGQEALGRMLGEDFALVLLDVQMPEMDGFETAELMRGHKNTRGVPIIFATAISKEQKHIFRGYDAGAVDYMFKPLDPDILRSKVDVFLQLYRQRRTLQDKTRELDAKIQELEKLRRQLERSNALLERLSAIDGLTGIYNRRRFDEVLDLEWRRAQRHQKPISLIFVDLDCFKNYNDHYGHLAGDDCLRHAAEVMSSVLKRPSDTMARYGGEEFAAILPDTTAKDAAALAEQMRAGVQALDMDHACSFVSHCVTVSMGVACMIPERGSAPSTLVAAADTALYEAKQTGRNRVIIHPDAAL